MRLSNPRCHREGIVQMMMRRIPCLQNPLKAREAEKPLCMDEDNGEAVVVVVQMVVCP